MQPTVLPIIITGVGVVVLVLTVVLGWIVVPNIIDNKIKEEVRLVNGSETWDKWEEIPVPVYLKFYVLHITNADDIEARGEIPKWEEHGPYTYRQKRVKINIEMEPGQDEVLSYEQLKTYNYDEEHSCDGCSEADEFNVINVPFVSVVAGIAKISPFLATLIANGVLGTEKFIMRNVKVGELLFEGFDVSLYTRTLGPLLPEEFDGGRFGIYKGENISTDGVYEIYTGTGKSSDFNVIKTWEGNTTLDGWWRPGTPCSMINGTDGSLFPPFVTKKWVMYVFNTDLCRTLHLVYEKEVEHKGIKGYRFVAPKDLLEDPRTNPANQCFCMEDDIEKCPTGGAIHVGACRGGAPIMMSTPHFLDGDKKYLEESGMSPPVKELHETFIDLEPNTGVTLAASKKIQVNLEVIKIPGVKATENLTNQILFPLLWADEQANLDDANADDLKSQLLTPLKIVNIAKWTLLGVSIAVVVLGAGFYIMRRRRSMETV